MKIGMVAALVAVMGFGIAGCPTTEAPPVTGPEPLTEPDPWNDPDDLVKLRVGGTYVLYVKQDEIAVPRIMYDDSLFRVIESTGELTGAHYIAISALKETEQSPIDVLDEEDHSSWVGIECRADGNGYGKYLQSFNIPDFGAAFGVAPSRFLAEESEDGGLKYLFGYALDSDRFASRTAEQIIDEYAPLLEQRGFSYDGTELRDDGMTGTRYVSDRESVTYFITEEDGLGPVLYIEY